MGQIFPKNRIYTDEELDMVLVKGQKLPQNENEQPNDSGQHDQLDNVKDSWVNLEKEHPEMQDEVQKDPREVSWDRSALDYQGDQKWVIAENVVKGED